MNTLDILLVDDEPRNLEALEAILDGEGYRLWLANNADRALRILLEHDVAAIVLDIKMPGVDGFELARIIKGTQRFRQVPILFLTAHLLEDADVIVGYGAGAIDYLTKPFNPEILRRKLGVYAELFRKSRALAELNERLEQRVQERTAELERSEAALRAAAKQKDEFLAILAHELRNPLVPLRSGLDYLIQSRSFATGAAHGTLERTLGAMNRQLDHIVRLIDDLLDVSRINSGVFELKLERVNLRQLIEDTTETFRGLLSRKRLQLAIGDLPDVSAVVDSARISQILGNLLHNASKYTEAGGTIRIELASEGTQAWIHVVDSGVGIAPEQLERVFEMFARVDRGVVAERGAGIGLALSRRLADMHGGELRVQSAGVGHGATFSLRIPGVEGSGVGTAADGAASQPERSLDMRRKIVVVEDNQDVSEALEALLSAMGHSVSVAASGPEGIQLVAQCAPHLILCDIGLPGMDGHEVCRRIRNLSLERRPCLVALTGWGQEADRRRTAEAGFDQHLVKPVSVEMLRKVVDDLTGC